MDGHILVAGFFLIRKKDAAVPGPVSINIFLGPAVLKLTIVADLLLPTSGFALQN
jgi:hypothetical protein